MGAVRGGVDHLAAAVAVHVGSVGVVIESLARSHYRRLPA